MNGPDRDFNDKKEKTEKTSDIFDFKVNDSMRKISFQVWSFTNIKLRQEESLNQTNEERVKKTI